MKSELSEKGYDEFRFLGQGAQGLVVLAKEKATSKRYAIKGIYVRDSDGNQDEIAFNQVQQEIKMLKECRGSPYVVNLIKEFEGKEFVFLVLTECLGTLNEIVQKTQNERLNELTAIKYAKDIAEGLYFIHSKNCLVNDLKKDNILIDYNGNAVVSDFGYADNLTQQSGYTEDEYRGNIMCKAPECYDEKQCETYVQEYKNLGITVKPQPSPRSEACSLGYLLYTMITGFNINLLFNKHLPLQYKPDFQNFVYQKQLQYIMDGLTKFIPRERLKIKEVLIILKGIISFEFELDNKFIEVIDDSAVQQNIKSFNSDIEFVQGFENKFYPVFKNEQELIFLLDSEINDPKQKQDTSTIQELNQKIKGLEQTIKDLESKLQGSYYQNIQSPFISNQQEMYQQGSSQNQQASKPMKKGYLKINSNSNYAYGFYDENKNRIGVIKKQDVTKDLQNMMIEDLNNDKYIGTVSLMQGKIIYKKDEYPDKLVYNHLENRNCLYVIF